MALSYFDRLLSLVNKEELEAIDKLIEEFDEFTIYTNLSRRIPKNRSSLTEISTTQNDRFDRHGLNWMMALARVELGAMLAGFTHSQNPFEIVSPSAYEIPAYKELLLDGAKSHYWALLNDSELKKVVRRPPDVRTLAYVRRLVIARAFLDAAAKIGAREYSSLQVAELRYWNKGLDNTQAGLVGTVQDYLNNPQTARGPTKTSSIVNACSRLLRAESSALRRGEATIQRIK